MSTFVPPVPDVAQLFADWQEWERGETPPGRVLTNMKTHGMALLMQQLIDSGWQPSA